MQFTGKIAAILVVLSLVGCGQGIRVTSQPDEERDRLARSGENRGLETRTTLREALAANRNQESIVKVNKYIWAASLQVLDFLPIQSVDPFTGVIVTGFGTPPGGGRAYRATVLIDDPALEARSLNVALQSRNGPASASTVRAVEDAILTRARQLRIADNRL